MLSADRSRSAPQHASAQSGYNARILPPSSLAATLTKPLARSRLAPVSLRQALPILVVATIVIFGAFLRVYHLGASSLWVDEAVIWDISRGSIGEILVENARRNSAPPTYPLLVKLAGNIWGTSEAQLRSVSVIAGVLGLVALSLLARQWLSWTGTALAVGIMALAPVQVSYSQELREYSFVVLLTILLFLSLNRVLSASTSYRRAAAYTLVALLAVSFQYGLVIVVAGAHFVYLVGALSDRSRKGLMLYAISTLCIFGIMAGVYFLSLQYRVETGKLTFWYLDEQYLSKVSLKGVVEYLSLNTTGLMRFTFSRDLWSAMAVLAVVGAFRFWTGGPRHRYGLLYLALPLLAVVALSMVRLYPYGGIRQDIFLAPMFYVLGAAGLEQLSRTALKSQVFRAILLLGLLWQAWLGLRPVYYELAKGEGEHLRPAAEYLGQHVSEGEAIYVYYGASAAFRYYWETRQLGSPHSDKPIIWGRMSREDQSGYFAELKQCFDQAERCWVVFSHTYDLTMSEQKLIVRWLQANYTLEDRFRPGESPSSSDDDRFTDTALYLFTRDKGVRQGF